MGALVAGAIILLGIGTAAAMRRRKRRRVRVRRDVDLRVAPQELRFPLTGLRGYRPGVTPRLSSGPLIFPSEIDAGVLVAARKLAGIANPPVRPGVMDPLQYGAPERLFPHTDGWGRDEGFAGIALAELLRQWSLEVAPSPLADELIAGAGVIDGTARVALTIARDPANIAAIREQVEEQQGRVDDWIERGGQYLQTGNILAVAGLWLEGMTYILNEGWEMFTGGRPSRGGYTDIRSVLPLTPTAAENYARGLRRMVEGFAPEDGGVRALGVPAAV